MLPTWGPCSSRTLEHVQEVMVGRRRKETLTGVIPLACTFSPLSRQASLTFTVVAGRGGSGGGGGVRLGVGWGIF